MVRSRSDYFRQRTITRFLASLIKMIHTSDYLEPRYALYSLSSSERIKYYIIRESVWVGKIGCEWRERIEWGRADYWLFRRVYWRERERMRESEEVGGERRGGVLAYRYRLPPYNLITNLSLFLFPNLSESALSEYFIFTEYSV